MTMRDLLTEVVGDWLQAWDEAAAAREENKITQDEIERFFDSPPAYLKEYALKAALESMGLELEDGPVNEESITAAILAGPLAGLDIDVSNLFDRAELMAALKKMAIERVCESLGLPGVSGVDGLKDAVRGLLVDEVSEQIASEAGALIDGAPDAAQISAALKSWQSSKGNQAVDFSAKGESNRLRQARYRAGHRKHWEER